MDATDTSASAPGATGKRRIPAGIIIGAAIVGVIVLGLAGVHLYFRSKINAELNAIRKAGFSVTLQELNDYYPVPQGENAAAVYTQAFAKFAEADTPLEDKLPVFGEGRLPPRGEPMSEDMKTDISTYLAANAQALELLHKAASIKGCRFDLDFSRGNEMPLPHFRGLRQAARLLELQALIKVEDGKPDDAATAIADSFGVARALQNEPLVISQLVRVAILYLTVGTLERALSRTTFGDKQLMELLKATQSQENPETLVRALAGERCLQEDYFKNSSMYDGIVPFNKVGAAVVLHLWDWSGLKAKDHLNYLRLMNGIISAAGDPANEMCDLTAEREEEVQQAPKYLLLTRLLVPTMLDVNRIQLNMLGCLRAAQAGIAVERFRLANGRLPDSLDELVPKWLDSVPADPFDDRPIRYKKLAKGFVTYSVGPDQKDHGGLEFDPKDSKAPHDITFIVAR